MSISSVAPGPDAFDPLRDIRNLAARNPAPPPTPGQAAATAQALSKAEVANDAAQARANPMFQAQDSRKTQARARLQQIRDWLNIVKKLYAENPRGMAQAVTQVVKDLKAALREYADAGGREMGMSDAAVTATLAPAEPEAAAKDGEAKADDAKAGEADAPRADASKTGDAGSGASATVEDQSAEAGTPSASRTGDSCTAGDPPSSFDKLRMRATEGDGGPIENLTLSLSKGVVFGSATSDATAPSGSAAPAQDTKADAPQTTPQPSAAPADGANLYGAVRDAVRKTIGEDGLEFLKEVREMAKAVKDLLISAKIQAAAHRRDKPTDKAFEDADKAFKDLDDEMTQTERDIRQAAPDVGMRLSVTG